MKKLVITIITFFLFIFDAQALTTINNMEISVYINEEGIAEIEEIWKLPNQNAGIIKKNFYNLGDATIQDLTITDNLNHSYVQNPHVNSNVYYYNLVTNGRNNYLNLNADGTESVINLKYKVNGMIKSYNDAEGINWYFLNTLSDMNVKSLNISISSYVPYTESNSALYIIGNNIECHLHDGKIVIMAHSLEAKNKIYLLTTFSDISYANKIEIDDNFEHYYKKNKPSIVNDIKNFLASETVLIILILAIIILMIVVSNIIIKKTKNNIFSHIKVKSKANFVTSIDNADYYEEIPCNTDFYRLEFLCNFFKITKNRSNIISAIILKWILAGYGSINLENKTIIINKNLTFENPLDQELYYIIQNACEDLVIRNNKMSNYFKNNPKIINEWFKHIYAHSIKCDYDEKNIKVKNKNLIANKVFLENANKIMGLKKYLLNFNQVSRSIPLTIKEYNDLLVTSCLLGISDSFSKEILRKNKDNVLAQLLSDFENMREILISFYEIKDNTFFHFKDYDPTLHKK